MNRKTGGHTLCGLLSLGVLIAAAALFAGERCRADDAPTGKPAAPVEQGQRIFTCGHSFHVFVYPLLDELAKSAGITDQEMVGISRIGGSRVIQHWDMPEGKNEAKRTLAAGKVDVLTLSPIWLPDAGIENFAKLAAEHNRKVRVLVQEFWLPNDTYEPIYPLDTRKKVDHDATDLAALRKANDDYCEDIEKLVRELNKEIGKDVLLVVPVGEASVALREKIVAGKDRGRPGTGPQGAGGFVSRHLGPRKGAAHGALGLLPFRRDLSEEPGRAGRAPDTEER